MTPELAARIKTRSSAARILGVTFDDLTEATIARVTDKQYINDFITHRSRLPDPRTYCMKTLKLASSGNIYEIWKRSNNTTVHYITTARSCSCPSFAWQEEHKGEIRQYAPSFHPMCKHQALAAKLIPMPITYLTKSTVMWNIQDDGCTMTWISRDGINFEPYKMLITIEEWINARAKTIGVGWHFSYLSPGVATRLNRTARRNR